MTEIINREEGIAMALDTLINITQDEKEFAYMTSLLKGELDWQSGMVNARKEGKAEGILEIARNSLDQGLPVELIHKITGLDIETIQSLK